MDKIRHFLLLLILIPFAGCVHSDPSGTPAGKSEPLSAASSEAVRVKAPLLWEVAKGKDKSFLFGTVHVGIDADRDLPASVWQAFSDSPCFVMEADQDEIDPRALMAMAKLPPGEKLADKVSPEVWKRIGVPRGLSAMRT